MANLKVCEAHLVVQHDLGSVDHDNLSITSFLAVDEHDAPQPAGHAHCSCPQQLLLGNSGAAIRQNLHQACVGQKNRELTIKIRHKQKSRVIRSRVDS